MSLCSGMCGTLNVTVLITFIISVVFAACIIIGAGVVSLIIAFSNSCHKCEKKFDLHILKIYVLEE